MSQYLLMIVVLYVKYVNTYTHSIKISAFYHLKWLSYGRKTEISNYKKGDNDVKIHDESTFSSLWALETTAARFRL